MPSHHKLIDVTKISNKDILYFLSWQENYVVIT